MNLDWGYDFISSLLNSASGADKEGIIAGMTAGQIAGYCVTWLIYAAIMYKLFQKADHPEPVKAFIPFYNYYEAFRITSGTGWFCILLFVPLGIVRLIGQIMLAVYVGRAFRKSTIYKLGMLFFPILFYGFLALSSGDRFFGINGTGHTPAEPGSTTVDFETVSNGSTVEDNPVHVEPVNEDNLAPVDETGTVTDVEEVEVTIE